MDSVCSTPQDAPAVDEYRDYEENSSEQQEELIEENEEAEELKDKDTKGDDVSTYQLSRKRWRNHIKRDPLPIHKFKW